MLKTTRLFRKVCLLAALLIAVAPAAAEAQVFQQGTVTTGHAPIWSTNNVIRDGGAATNGNISEIGITSSAGIAFGIKNGLTTSPYTQFGVGVVTGSGVQITDTAIGGAAHLPINFVVNGNTSLTVNDAGVLVNGVPIIGNTIPNNTVLGNVSGSTAAPGAITGTQVSTMLGLGTAAFVNTGTSGATIPLLSTANTWSLPQTFGVNLGTGGALVLSGATSGSATVNVAAVAGTGTVFRLPASNGTSTYFLQTDGAGVTSWQPVSASVFTGILLGANGGTGVANTGKTVTLGGDLATSGAFTTTLTMTGATSLTLPTSGTVTALGNTVTGSGSIVLATAPALVTPALGVATATSLAIGGATIGSNGLAVAGHLLFEGVTSTGATGTGALVFAASPTITGTGSYTGNTVTANTSITAPAILPSSTNLSLGGTLGAESLRVVTVASAVQHIAINGAITGGAPILYVDGTDANSGLFLSSQGTGTVSLGAGQGARIIANFVDAASGNNFTFTRGTNPTISTGAGGLSVGSGGGVTTAITDSAPTLPNIVTGTNADVLCVDAGKVIRLQAAASCTISSQRFKTDIRRAWSGLWDLLWLRPSFFKRIGQEENPDNNAVRTQLGLIAEDVAAVEPAATLYEQDGVTPKAYHDEAIIAMLVNGAQQQLVVDGVLFFVLVFVVGLSFRRRRLTT